MTVINMHKPYFIFKTYVMSVLCTPLQVKRYRNFTKHCVMLSVVGVFYVIVL